MADAEEQAAPTPEPEPEVAPASAEPEPEPEVAAEEEAPESGEAPPTPAEGDEAAAEGEDAAGDGGEDAAPEEDAAEEAPAEEEAPEAEGGEPEGEVVEGDAAPADDAPGEDALEDVDPEEEAEAAATSAPEDEAGGDAAAAPGEGEPGDGADEAPAEGSPGGPEDADEAEGASDADPDAEADVDPDALEGEDVDEDDEAGSEYTGEDGELSPSFTDGGVDVRVLLSEAYEEEQELRSLNKSLEQKLIQLQKFKALAKPSSRGLTTSIVSDLEARYYSSLNSWANYVNEEQRIATHYDSALMDMKLKVEERDSKAIKLEEDYKAFKMEVIKSAEHSRTGKPIPNHTINEINLLEDEKEGELEKVRIRNIQLQYNLRELEGRLKQKEELAEGLHLIDFEQLKIENQR